MDTLQNPSGRNPALPLRSTMLGLLCCVGASFGCTGDQPSVELPSVDSSGVQAEGNDVLLLASARVALPPPGLMPADLPDAESIGAQQFSTFCVVCHALPSPRSHSVIDWPRVMNRMWLRMGLIDPEFHVPVPNTAQRLVMLRYVERNALVVVVSELPDLMGRELFEYRCSSCHQLPDPYQHSSQDWPVVVRRMMDHMSEIIGLSLTSSEYSELSSYLSEVASRGR